MKKDLAIRIGAILMVLMVAFLSILPDLVNAEGDDPQPSTEVESQDTLASADGVETPDDANDEAAPDASEEAGNPQEPETPDDATDAPETNGPEGSDGVETPDNTQEPDENPLPPETETPDGSDSDASDPSIKDPEEDIAQNGEQKEPETVNPPTDQNPAENEQPVTDQAQPDQTSVNPPTDTAPQTPDIGEKIRAELQKEEAKETGTRTVTPIEVLEEMYSINTNEEDFNIEGSTVTGYKGAGGYVAIPDGITAIGDNAFFNQTNITGVLFPASLRTIGSSAFNGCSNLESVVIPGGVTTVGASAFANCTGLSGVSLSASAGTVSQGQFYNCSSLTSIEVPEGVTSIASGAFGGCANLSSVSLPSSLVNLDMGAFSGDVSLTSISAAGGSYSSHDGCVYSADGRQLLLCPQGKTGIAFSPQTSQIASGAFNSCGYLLSVTVPSSVTAIAADAFSGSAIKTVTIPASVTSIGSQAGWQPSVVYGVYGSEAEAWAKRNHYIFEGIEGAPADTNTSVEDPLESIEDPDPKKEKEEDPKKPSKSGQGTSPVYNAAPGTGTGSQAAITKNSGGTVRSGTPKTGVEDYGVYFLFGAVFLIGIALFAYSRKLRIDANQK